MIGSSYAGQNQEKKNISNTSNAFPSFVSNKETAKLLSIGSTFFSDDFNDGDFTNNPTWNLTPGGTGCWAPGTRDVVNGEFHVRDMDSPGCGHSTMIDYDVNASITDITRIKFDVNPVFSDVRNGDGDAHYEYPGIVQLDLYDSGNNLLSLWFCYNYRGGVSTTESNLIRVSFPNVPQNTWQRNQSFRVKDYFPNAVRIGKIYVGAIGWDYEAYFDNISIYDDDQSTLPKPELNTPVDGSIDQSLTPILDWLDTPGATSYTLQISTNPTFNTVVIDRGSIAASHLVVPTGLLTDKTVYYWRVNSSNSSGTSPWSDVWSFKVDTDLLQLEKYAPYFYLDNYDLDKEWFPTEVKMMTDNSRLIYYPFWSACRKPEIKYENPVLDNLQTAGDDWKYYLELKNPQAASSQGYPKVVYGRKTTDYENRTILQYWIFYPYNDWRIDLFDHEGDWEMVELKFNSLGTDVEYVATAIHQWFDLKLKNEVEWIDYTHPKVYVAKGSHGSYLTPICRYTIGGIVPGIAVGTVLGLVGVPAALGTGLASLTVGTSFAISPATGQSIVSLLLFLAPKGIETV